jgi:hypothetical protein
MRKWKLRIISGVCFMLLGIVSLFINEFLTSIICIFISVFDFALSRYDYKHEIDKQAVASNTEIENIEDELKSLIIEGKEFEAVKKYKIATGFGLKEAKEHVDFLKESLIKQGDNTFRV